MVRAKLSGHSRKKTEYFAASRAVYRVCTPEKTRGTVHRRPKGSLWHVSIHSPRPPPTRARAREKRAFVYTSLFPPSSPAKPRGKPSTLLRCSDKAGPVNTKVCPNEQKHASKGLQGRTCPACSCVQAFVALHEVYTVGCCGNFQLFLAFGRDRKLVTPV